MSVKLFSFLILGALSEIRSFESFFLGFKRVFPSFGEAPRVLIALPLKEGAASESLSESVKDTFEDWSELFSDRVSSIKLLPELFFLATRV